jgi:alcohol dehydrogenase class IV
VYDASKRDSIVGIGGGAALDEARAIVLRVNHREDLFKYDDLIGGDVFVTNDVPHFITIPTTAGTPTQYHNVLIHKEAWALAMQQAPRLQAQYLVASLAWLVVVDSIYGTTTIRPTFGVEVRS